MTPEQFADQCRLGIVEENVASYRQILDDMDAESITDKYWLSVSKLYRSLDDEGRKTVLAVMRQVSIDATASLLAVIDGVAEFEGQEGTFELSRKNGQTSIVSGDLSDLFLEAIETAEHP